MVQNWIAGSTAHDSFWVPHPFLMMSLSPGKQSCQGRRGRPYRRPPEAQHLDSSEADQGACSLLPSFSNYKLSCRKIKWTSLFESRKPVFHSSTLIWKCRIQPCLTFPTFSPFVPLSPCWFIIKNARRLSLDGGKSQRLRVLGLVLNSQHQKSFFPSGLHLPRL